MADLALLQEELDQVAQRRDALRAAHPGDTMPEEARSQDEELMNRGKRVIALLEQAKQEKRDREFDELMKYNETPLRNVGFAVNSDDAGRRNLIAAGWSVKNGGVFRAASNGNEVMYCSEEVMFGPIPTDDPEAATYYRQTRAIFQPEYRAAFNKYITLCGRTGDPNMAMLRLSGAEQNALSEGRDDAGGFLVPPDAQAELLSRLAQQSVFRRLARVVPTTRDVVRWPTLKANATNGSIYSSAFVGDWAGETPVFADTDPSFQMFEIGVKKIRCATKLSNDFISDSSVGVIAMLSEDGAQNMALVEEKGFLTGNGAGLQPLGLLNIPGASTLVSSGGEAIDVEGSTSNTISNTTASVGTVPKIQDLVYALPSQYAANASLLMCRSVEGKTRKLVDANGRFMWNSYNESGYANPQRTIDGIPVYNSEWMPNDGTDANQVYALGDMKNYIIVERAAFSVRVLNERYADSDQTGIILTERVGGGAWNTDAFRFGIV